MLSSDVYGGLAAIVRVLVDAGISEQLDELLQVLSFRASTGSCLRLALLRTHTALRLGGVLLILFNVASLQSLATIVDHIAGLTSLGRS